MAWEDGNLPPRAEPARKLRPNIIARLVRRVIRYPLVAIAVWIMLAMPAAVLACVLLFSSGVVERENVTDPAVASAEQAFEKEFNEPGDAIIAVIDSSDAQQARQAASMLADRLGANGKLFGNVFAPGAGSFFDDYGILYLDTEEVDRIAMRIEHSAPLYRALSVAPNLTGLAVLAEQTGRAVSEGRSPEGFNDLFRQAALTVQAQLQGRERPLDWLSLVPHGGDLDSKRWFVMAHPLNDGVSAGAVNEARRQADALASELQGRVTIALTGKPVLASGVMPVDARTFVLPAVLSLFLAIIVASFGLTRFGQVIAVLVAWTAGLAVALLAMALIFGPPDRLLVCAPLAYSCFAGLALCSFTLRTEEAMRANIPKHGALMLAGHNLGPALLFWLAGFAIAGAASLAQPSVWLIELAGSLAMMAGAAFLVTFTFLPALLRILPAPVGDHLDDDEAHWLDELIARARGWRMRYLRRGVAVVLIAASAIFAMMLPSLRIESTAPLDYANGGKTGQLFRELVAREPALIAAGHVMAKPGDEARALVRAIAALPEVAGVRWIEIFLPPEQDEKRARLAKLQGVYPRFPTQTEPLSDTDLVNSFRRLQLGLQAIAAQPAAGKDLVAAATELRRSLNLLEGNGLATPVELRKLDRASFGRLQVLFDSVDRLSRLEPLTIEKLDPAILRRYVAKDGRWRIEVQPRDPLNLDGFIAAMRELAPAMAGKALIEADTRRLLRDGVPWLLAGWLAAILLMPVIVFRKALSVVRGVLPVTSVTLLMLGSLALMHWPLYPESIVVLAFMLALGSGAAMVNEAWQPLPPEAGANAPDSSVRAILVVFLLVLAAFGPLILSQSPAAQGFGELVFLGVLAVAIGHFLILPQLRSWTGRRLKPRPQAA
ncbi:MAG: hypothetical protein AB7F76_04445 [Parvibaculaceae bacterium]